MIIKFEEDFLYSLNEQVRYIAKDKPLVAKKFKIDLLKNLKKDLKQPFNFKKSIYFNDETIRDYVFKGYKIVYYINLQQKIIYVFGFIKYKDSL
jgi:plasmid stabilization system protein ParE